MNGHAPPASGRSPARDVWLSPFHAYCGCNGALLLLSPSRKAGQSRIPCGTRVRLLCIEVVAGRFYVDMEDNSGTATALLEPSLNTGGDQLLHPWIQAFGALTHSVAFTL